MGEDFVSRKKLNLLFGLENGDHDDDFALIVPEVN